MNKGAITEAEEEELITEEEENKPLTMKFHPASEELPNPVDEQLAREAKAERKIRAEQNLQQLKEKTDKFFGRHDAALYGIIPSLEDGSIKDGKVENNALFGSDKIGKWFYLDPITGNKYKSELYYHDQKQKKTTTHCIDSFGVTVFRENGSNKYINLNLEFSEGKISAATLYWTGANPKWEKYEYLQVPDQIKQILGGKGILLQLLENAQNSCLRGKDPKSLRIERTKDGTIKFMFLSLRDWEGMPLSFTKLRALTITEYNYKPDEDKFVATYENHVHEYSNERGKYRPYMEIKNEDEAGYMETIKTNIREISRPQMETIMKQMFKVMAAE